MASHSKVSRRRVLARAAALTVGGGMLGPSGLAMAAQAPAIQTGTQAGRRYRAFMRYANTTTVGVEPVTMLPLDENRVVVRTEASQCCYSIVGQALGQRRLNDNGTTNLILGHGGVGIVEAIGSKVRRVQVGDRVIVANTPYCGLCYMCLHGRPDRCSMLTTRANVNPFLPVATLTNGQPVIQHNNEAGLGELMIPYEWYCMPIFNAVSPVELSMLACSGACGLGAAFGVAPVEPGSDVCVLGCGLLGLSAVQGARIKGASQIIAVEPIPERRAVAQAVGATTVLDPNVNTDTIVATIKNMCKGPTTRKFAGGREWTDDPNQMGPDYVIEAVGGDAFPPKVPGPDPTGLLPLRWAWDLCSAAGHVTTVSVGQPGNITIPGWFGASKNHHPGNMTGVNTLRDMQRFARLIETGQFNAKIMATATYPLERTREAIQVTAERTTVAAVIVFS